jgi:hypothetical protein
MRKFIALLTLLAGSLANLPLARACAVCLGGDGSIGEAYEWSVLFLMATPYLVMGSIAGYLVYAYRRAARRQEEEAAGEEAPVHLALEQEESAR